MTLPHTSLLELLLLFVFLPLSVGCQNSLAPSGNRLEFEHLTREDGLPSNTVNTILQDHRGMMWFGTSDGLVQYDGYSCKIYKNKPNDPQSLHGNLITTLYEDRKGTIWVGTSTGLAGFDRGTETFKNFRFDPEDPLSLSSNYIFSILEDQRERLWVGTQDGGLNLMDREKETFSHYLPDPDYEYGFISNNVTTIIEDDALDGVLWLGTTLNRDVYTQFDTESKTFTFLPGADKESQPAKGRHIHSLLKRRNGEIWFGTNEGLDFALPPQKGLTNYHHHPGDSTSLSNNRVQTIFEDLQSTLWATTVNGGLNQWQSTSGSFLRYRHQPGNPKSLGSDNTTTVYEHQSGILWVGTANAGISYADRNERKFEHLKPYVSHKKNISRKYSVEAVLEDSNGVLWLGTSYEGLLYYDEGTKSFNGFEDAPGNLRLLNELSVWSLLEDQEGMLWIGSNSKGLYRYDQGEETLTVYKNDPTDTNSLAANYITAILESKEGSLWIGTSAGLQRLNRKTGVFQRVELTDTGIENQAITFIYEDHLQNIWIASPAGLFCLNAETEVVLRFSNEPADPNGFNSYVYYIREDRLGNIWLGTPGGLLKLHLAAGDDWTNKAINLRQYTEKDGLPGNNIMAILEDDAGQLWISTQNGLSLFSNPQHGEQSLPDFKNYDIKDGLQAYEFDNATAFKNSKGELFFGGLGGVNRFHPDSLRKNTFAPPVVITAFKTFDVDVPEQGAVPIRGISEKKELSLSYKKNIFSIDFAALSYREAHKNQYAYQMEGFNDSWIPLGTDHQVTFTNLDPGDYVFRVRAANNDGLWNETPAELKITITPPWWKTIWAYFLYAFIFLGILLFWRNYELNRRQLKHDLEIRRMEAEKLQELDEVKSRFFANISHEFRTPLTLILGPIGKLITEAKGKKDSHLLRLMERNAQRLQRLINQLLDISKLEAGKMQLETQLQDVVSVVKRIFYAFESMAIHKGIHQRFETRLDIALLYFDADKLEHVIVNVLSNAFKFTSDGGTVTVGLDKILTEAGTPFFRIEVVDDGAGIAPEQLPYVFNRFYQGQDQHTNAEQGSGIGLALTKELVELHHGKIALRSELGKGTTVTILLPFGKQHLRAEEIVAEGTDGQPSVPELSPQVADEVKLLLEGTAILPASTPKMEAENSALPIILLAEDNQDMRLFLKDQLAETYRVIEAVDGQDGLEKALEIIPDLIVSDVMMPRMDGLVLCERLKKEERTSHIPIILLTAKADLAARIDGLERGADTYLAKPFNQRELLAHVHNLLEVRQRLQARYATTQRPPPATDKGTAIEDAFLQKARKIVMEHLTDEDFDMERFSHLVGMSRSQLFRKIKALTGKSPSRFIRSIRLHRAKELLENTELNVSEVAYEVGFSSPGFFSDAFLEHYGIRPSEVRG